MSRSDPGAANGGPVREPDRCTSCGRLETFHPIRRSGTRGPFLEAGCTGYRAARPTLTVVPGAGVMPAPAGPPPHTFDLDAIGDRYTDLLEARARGDEHTANLLAQACADDVPLLREELHRVTVALRGTR